VLAIPAAPAEADSGPRSIVFEHVWIGDIDQIGFNEPSGIVFHEGRGTLFVVGAEGDICEIETDGTLVMQAHIRDGEVVEFWAFPGTTRKGSRWTGRGSCTSLRTRAGS
jgi:hypothetical protein